MSSLLFKDKITSLLKLKNFDFFINSSGPSRGVAIAIKSGIFDDAHIVFNCPSFNSMVINFKKGDFAWTTAVVYLDCDDNLQYVKNLEKVLKNTGLPIFMGGDLNSVMDPESLLNIIWTYMVEM